MNKLFICIVLIISNIAVFAQTETAPPPPPPPPVEEMIEEDVPVFEDVEIEEAPVFMDMEVEEETAPVSFRKSDQYYDSKIGRDRITDGIEYFYQKYSDEYPKKYGILKNGNVLLPMIFVKHGYSYNTEPAILGLGFYVGLYDYNTETWTIPIMYESLSKLRDNLYVAKLNNQYGIIDDKNNIVVDLKWGSINGISGIDNYIKVSNTSYQAKNYGIYNIPEKKMTIPCMYSNISEIENASYFKVQDGVKHNIVDINNKPRFKTWYDQLHVPNGGRKLYIVQLDSKMGVVDENGKEVIPIEYPEIKTYPYNDGSYLAKNKDGKYGCIMLDGRVTLPFVYDNVNTTYGNNVVAMKNSKCGIVQVNNGLPYEITTCDYDSIVGTNNVFLVSKNNKFGLLDLYGKLIAPIEYDEIESTSTNYYDQKNVFIGRKKNSYYLMNNSGEVLNTKPYTSLAKLPSAEPNQYYNSYKYNYLVVQNDKGKYGLLDKYGAEVLAPSLDGIFNEYNNVVTISKNGQIGLYDIFNKKELIPCEYDQIIIDKNVFIGIKGKDFYYLNTAGGAKKIE